ncbi:MAG: hypothetical protein MHPSP_002613, partial [Paramarteilia canceri]
YATGIPSQTLLKQLMPGPITLILNASPKTRMLLNNGNAKVGVRIPNTDLLLDILKQCDEPLAQTSANLSGDKSSTKIEEFKSIYEDIDLVVDSGEIKSSGKSSTIIDLTYTGIYKIIREGR